MKRLDGAESVDVSLQRASAAIRLRQGNQVRLEQLRDVIKANGFTPKDISVVAIGRARSMSGRLVLEVSGIGTNLVLAPGRSDAAAIRQLQQSFEKAPDASIEVSGTVTALKDGTNELAVTRFRSLE
jgi:hypothetical protein